MAADTTLTTTTGDGADDVASSLQRLFQKDLLKTIVENTILDQFGKKISLPAKAGSKTMRFFRYGEAAASNVEALTEGTAPTSSHLAVENVDADLVQYGEVISISDLVLATELFNNVEQATVRAGRDAALKVDEVIRAELFKNDADIPGANNIYSGATDAYNNTITAVNAKDFLDSATSLKLQKAIPIGGSYCAIVAPQVARDLMNDGDWIAANHYASPENILRGEVGRMHGVRIVETTVPFSADVATQFTHTGGDYFGTAVVGQDAFAIPNLGSQSPFAPSIVIVTSPDKSDPLNQKVTVGFKVFFVAKNIQPKHIARIYSTTNYGS